MSLDFNTQTTQEITKAVVNENPVDYASASKFGSKFRSLLLLGGLFLSISSVVLSLFTIKNIPKPDPVVISCDPDLLEKIEKQAKLLTEIAKSAATKK